MDGYIFLYKTKAIGKAFGENKFFSDVKWSAHDSHEEVKQISAECTLKGDLVLSYKNRIRRQVDEESALAIKKINAIDRTESMKYIYSFKFYASNSSIDIGVGYNVAYDSSGKECGRVGNNDLGSIYDNSRVEDMIVFCDLE